MVLNCTVEANPTPSITWTRDDGNPVDQQQGITGFRQTAFSVLTVPVVELEGRVEFTCQAGLTEHTSIVINSYSELCYFIIPLHIHTIYPSFLLM